MSDQAPLHRIDIRIETSYLPEQSDPEHERHLFAYTITLRNTGSVPARLLSRHWIITDGNARVQEVRGSGVVGEQPYLAPGESFEYTSSCMLATPVGVMQGSYHMQADNGDEYDAPIPPFRLCVPGVLN